VIADNISVRIPKNNIIVEIARSFGKPITATSANITGKEPATSVRSLDPKIYLKADMIIDDPDFRPALPSTVVDIITDQPKVLRKGDLSFP